MANPDLSGPMRKIKEVLRLKYDCGLSDREITQSCQVSRSTVADYLIKVKSAGANWPEAAALTEAQLKERLYPPQRLPLSVQRPPPDCEYIYNQLRPDLSGEGQSDPAPVVDRVQGKSSRRLSVHPVSARITGAGGANSTIPHSGRAPSC